MFSYAGITHQWTDPTAIGTLTNPSWGVLDLRVMAPTTLTVSWHKVQANKGAAGVDGLSIGRFAAKADLYLSELAPALRRVGRADEAGAVAKRALDQATTMGAHALVRRLTQAEVPEGGVGR